VPRLWRQWLGALAFRVLRRYPRWAAWVPGRRESTSVPAAGAQGNFRPNPGFDAEQRQFSAASRRTGTGRWP
jgi:hypothetical protein